MVNLVDGSVKEVLALGGTLTSALGSWPSLKTTRPTVACLPDGRLMLGKDGTYQGSWIRYHSHGSPTDTSI